VDEFDPLFFNISPREAESMDPQQRLLMTYTWQAIEDAGYSAQSLSGSKTAIFVGTASSGYSELVAQENSSSVEGHSSTSGVPSIGPNRMSYLLNLHGPSEPIETACSSSLVAIHRAVRAMQSGDCEMALVGGINTIITPWAHIGFNKAGMLCEDGRCKTFSKNANGYVRGEGVGMLFLKKLSQAEQDGDHIYGLIKGSSENHGGRANSLTAPNPKAQAELLKAAYRDAKIDPRTVSYIEAHGTGTPLGDPIEIDGLKSAFADLAADQADRPVSVSYCGIGSVKTNIGHLELAAGVASVIKVLLQLKHKTLLKSLHSAEINPYIQLQDTPFYIVKETQHWAVQKDAQGRALPRRAGVSSVGFGGVNAHVVIEEYLGTQDMPTVLSPMNTDRPALVVLSAKNEERLKEKAQALLSHLQSRHYTSADLINIAYTLQVGREAMEHRLAFTAATIMEFQEKLAGYGEGKVERKGMESYRGEVKKNKETIAIFNADDALQLAIASWIEQGKYTKLLELWVKGLYFDWTRLYGEGSSYATMKPKRISLPTYPFAKERYWIDQRGEVSQSLAKHASVLHPLVQINTSTLDEQRFTSTLSGDEFYLRDHVVSGNKVLPGVCYLEMARAAVERSVGLRSAGARVTLRNVVWVQPVAVSEATEVHIGLYSNERDEIEFEIYTEKAGTDAEVVIHAQGRAVLMNSDSSEAVEAIDLSLLRSQCDQSIEVAQCYAAFSAIGIEYGPAHRGLTSVQVGTDAEGDRFVLAQVTLPHCVSETQDEYGLHPSMLDSALQAAIGFSLGTSAQLNEGERKTALPFALETLQILDRSPAVAMVVVRPCETSRETTQNPILKLDIDICDESGRVCVRMQGFASRALTDEASSTLHSKKLLNSTMLLTSCWDVVTPSLDEEWPNAQSKMVLVGGTSGQQNIWRKRYPQLSIVVARDDSGAEEIARQLYALDCIDHVIWLAPNTISTVTDEQVVSAQVGGVIGLNRLVKALLLLGYGERHLEVTVMTWQTQSIYGEPLDPTHASVHGFVGSLAKEYESWRIRLVDLPCSENEPSIATLNEIVRLPADPQGNAWAYRASEWYRQQLLPCELEESSPLPYRSGGVYVVLGGADGLGEVFSEFLVKHHQAKLIWIGRCDLTAEIQSTIERLSKIGPSPLYMRVDAADGEALEQAYRRIKATYPDVHGVVHSEMVLPDQDIAQIDDRRFIASLAAEVDWSVRFAQLFESEALDFVVFLSSLQSLTKMAGQSNYAAVSAFRNAFAHRLSQVWTYPVKNMIWEYWDRKGATASEIDRARMAQRGIGSIEPEEGMAALAHLLSSSVAQLALIKIASFQGDCIPGKTRDRSGLVEDRLPSMTELVLDTEQ
jgi:polyketide synthase PksN